MNQIPNSTRNLVYEIPSGGKGNFKCRFLENPIKNSGYETFKKDSIIEFFKFKLERPKDNE